MMETIVTRECHHVEYHTFRLNFQANMTKYVALIGIIRKRCKRLILHVNKSKPDKSLIVERLHGKQGLPHFPQQKEIPLDRHINM